MSSALGQEAIVSKLTSLPCSFIKMPYLSNLFCIYLRDLWKNTKWATRINRLANHPGGKNNSWLITYPIKSAYLSAYRISISRPQFPLIYSLFAFSQWVCCKTDYSLWLAPLSSSCQLDSFKWLFFPWESLPLSCPQRLPFAHWNPSVSFSELLRIF